MTKVQLEVRGKVAIATIDNPPVNALGAAVREGLASAIKQANADAAVAAIVIASAGKAFIAGADISEFGKPPAPPILPDLLAAIENAPKPVVAAIEGVALGGGLSQVCGGWLFQQGPLFIWGSCVLVALLAILGLKRMESQTRTASRIETAPVRQEPLPG